MFNVLEDAGCIPHFAYQSLIGYGSEDKDAGTAYTYRNKYLITKEHMQFELLGLDDANISETYDFMEKMVVEDITDNCKTILCPAKLMEDIYRIWCCSRTRRFGNYPYDMYFENEYKEYANPKISFEDNQDCEWTVGDDDLFSILEDFQIPDNG